MKFSVNKYEVVGILVSVAVMIVVLMYLKGSTEETIVTDNVGTTNRTTVVTTDEEQGVSLTNAIVDASSPEGKLLSLVVDDVRIGKGASVKEGDVVVVNYIGSTRKGVQFDNSYEREQPFTFTIGEGRVIEGWEKGLIGMKVGGQRMLIIPSEMAYGNRQVGPIPANSILVFAIELVAIQ